MLFWLSASETAAWLSAYPTWSKGVFADFLTADTNRFVGLHQEPPIELANYKTAAQLGDNHQLNPVVAWNNWPLTDDQVDEVVIESHACFLVALRDHRLWSWSCLV